MIKLRDHYFIAWLKVVKGCEVHMLDDGIFVNISNDEYSKVMREYELTMKDLLKEIRKFVKELAIYTSKRS